MTIDYFKTEINNFRVLKECKSILINCETPAAIKLTKRIGWNVISVSKSIIKVLRHSNLKVLLEHKFINVGYREVS